MDGWHETDIRVRYAETDRMGIVHHSNYLVWFEAARTDLFRAIGFSYLKMEEESDALMVVGECYIRYKSPAFYDDVLTIRTRVTQLRSRSLRFFYEVYRRSDDTLLAEGETMHVITNRSKKVRTLPQMYRDRLLDYIDITLSDDDLG